MKPQHLLVSRTLTILCLLLTALASAQPDTLWTRTLSGNGDYYVERMSRDGNDAITLFGTTSDTPGGDADFYSVALSPQGQFADVHRYGDSLSQFLACASGNLLCGFELELNPTHTNAIVVLTNDGGTVWSAQLPGNDTLNASASVCGMNADLHWFAGNRVSGAASSPFLDLRSANGAPLALHTYTAESRPTLSDGVTLSDHSYLFAGTSYFEASAQTRPWVVHANSDGAQDWSRVYPGDGDSYLLSVAEVPAGGYICAGLSMTYDAEGDFYALRLAANGDVLWERWYGQPEGEDHGHRIIPTPDGGFLFGGHTHNHMGGEEQYVVYKLAANGDVDWRIESGGPEAEVVNDLVLTSDGGFAFCGNAISEEGYAATYIARYGSFAAVGEPPLAPHSFVLSPASPNPFNPATRIGYDLPDAAGVALKIFDLRGALVRTLLDETQPAGTHAVEFDGSNLPSGVYFARLAVGNEIRTQKLVLLK